MFWPKSCSVFVCLLFMDWPSIPWCHWAIRFLNLVTLRHCCSAQLGWFEWFHLAKCFRSRVEVLASISSNSIIVTSLTESLRTQMNDFSHSSPNSDAVHILIPSHSVGLYSIQLNCVSNYNSLIRSSKYEWSWFRAHCGGRWHQRPLDSLPSCKQGGQGSHSRKGPNDKLPKLHKSKVHLSVPHIDLGPLELHKSLYDDHFQFPLVILIMILMMIVKIIMMIVITLITIEIVTKL